MDIQKTWMMLEIIDKSRHWPNLKPIHDLAMSELQEIAEEVVKEAAAKREKEQKRLQPAEPPKARPHEESSPPVDRLARTPELRTQGTDGEVTRPSLSTRMQESGDKGETEMRRP